MSSENKQSYVICPLCHQPTPEGNTFCQYCWTELAAGEKVGSEAAKEFTQKKEAETKRKKTTKRVLYIGVPAILVLVIAFLFVFYNTEVFDKPSPTLNSNSAANQWSMFRHDMLRSGSADLNAPALQGNIQWTFSTGGAIQSSPAVAGSTVYFGSRDGKIYAVNAATGAEQWEYQTGSWVDSSPAVVNNIVYVGSNDGNLYALDAGSGRKLWVFQTSDPIISSPAVAGGVVYFGGDDDRIYALNAMTGKKLWVSKTGGQVTSSPLVANGVVYVGSSDGYLYSFNTTDGRLRIRFPRSEIISSPAVDGKNVYFTCSDGFLFAIDGGTHSWPAEYFILNIWTQAAVWGFAPYPPSITGVTVQQQIGTMNVSSPAIANNTLYVGVDFYMAATNLQGKTLWMFKAGDEIASSPAISGNAVYVGSYDGKIYAVDATTGKQLWNVSTGDKIGSSPALADGLLYIGSYDGKLYAIK